MEKVFVTIEGKSNQLYAQGMTSFEQCDEICKYFAKRKQRDTNANEMRKQLKLHDLNIREYLTYKYASWINFRTIDESTLHGTGKAREEESPCKSRRKLN